MDIVIPILAGLLGPLVVFGLVRLRDIRQSPEERHHGERSSRVTGFYIQPAQARVKPLVSERPVVSPPVAWRGDAPNDRPAEERVLRGGKYGSRAAGATAVRSSDECSECIRNGIRGATYCLNCGRRLTPV